MNIVFCTTPKDKSDFISEELLKEKLVACVNIIDTVKSKYWWEGKIQTDEESLLIIKTKKELKEKLIYKLKSIHPYEVPEIVFFNIEDVNSEYLDWVKLVTL